MNSNPLGIPRRIIGSRHVPINTKPAAAPASRNGKRIGEARRAWSAGRHLNSCDGRGKVWSERPEHPAADCELNILRMIMGKRNSAKLTWIVPIAVTLVASVALMLLGRAVDFWLLSDRPELVWRGWFIVADAETARIIILSVLEVLAGVFAISITVVAIIVQLSATRYTSRVVDLFLADPFNRLVLFAYVVPLVYGFWLADAITPEVYSRTSMTLFIVFATLSIVLVIPYFNFVFRFLQPTNIIKKIERSSEKAIMRARVRPGQMEKYRYEVTNSIQQLSDISQASIAHSDIALALECLNSLRSICILYLQQKSKMDARWFNVDRGQILGLSDEMRMEIVRTRIWVEMEIFKRYEIAFTSSLRKVRDINSCVAMNLREIGAVAAITSDDETLEFVIKGFNTFIMYALSDRDIRSAVHVFYQYRMFAESVLYRADIVEKIAHHFKYYGQNSQRRRIFFIMDAIAYDLRVLIELSIDKFPETLEGLMGVFLELDQEAKSAADLNSLKGVRKSQAMLGGFFIRRGREDLARRVMADMVDEEPEFIETVKRELYAVATKAFWEIEDRGVSFYYVAPEERESMDVFFSWLLQPKTTGGESARLK